MIDFFQEGKFAPDGNGRYRSAPAASGTGNNRPRPAPIPTDSDQPQPAWTGTNLGLVCAGPYRVSNGLCRYLTIDIDQHRPLETRNGPELQVGNWPVPVPVDADQDRLVPVWAGWFRFRLVPTGAGSAERSQETLYILTFIFYYNRLLLESVGALSRLN